MKKTLIISIILIGCIVIYLGVTVLNRPKPLLLTTTCNEYSNIIYNSNDVTDPELLKTFDEILSRYQTVSKKGFVPFPLEQKNLIHEFAYSFKDCNGAVEPRHLNYIKDADGNRIWLVYSSSDEGVFLIDNQAAFNQEMNAAIDLIEKSVESHTP